MRKLGAVVVAVASFACARAAHADGPTMRLGLTYALHDDGVGNRDVGGPLIALGMRGGPIVVEAEWAYLSFFDVDTANSHGVQRVGLSLRADVLRRYATHCLFRFGCTRASSVWVEAGAGERFGQWRIDAADISPASSREPEAHVALGIELDNQAHPMRNGWQLGLRFAMSPRGYGTGALACRAGGGTDCMPTTSSPWETPTTAADRGGYDKALLAEWMFLFGR